MPRHTMVSGQFVDTVVLLDPDTGLPYRASGGSGGGGGDASAAKQDAQTAKLTTIDSNLAGALTKQDAQTAALTSIDTRLVGTLTNQDAQTVLLGSIDTTVGGVLSRLPAQIAGRMPVDDPAFDPLFQKQVVGTARDKFRDGFFSFDTAQSWDLVSLGAGMSWAVDGVSGGARYLKVVTGVTPSSETIILSKASFRLPAKLAVGLSMSQRIANQEVFVELVGVDDTGVVESDATYPSTNLNNALNCAAIKVDGTTAANALSIVRGYGISELAQASSAYVTTAATGVSPNFLPAGFYEINADMEEVVFAARSIDSLASITGLNKRTQCLPDPLKQYKVRLRVRNLGTAPASSTDVRFHFVRVLDTTRLSVDMTRYMGRSNDPGDSIPVVLNHTPSVSVSGNPAVVGAAAEDAAASGNPVLVGGVVRTAVAPTSLVAGDVCRTTMTNGGAAVVKLNSVPETDWQYTGALTTAAAVAAKAAGAAGIRNYVTDISYQNTSATATTVLLQDGATTIAQWHAPASMTAPANILFRTPRRGTAATAMNVNCGTAGANVLINVGGYQAP